MFLNSRGQAVLGQAGGPCSVDGRMIITPGGGACWLDDDHVLVNTGSDATGWAVVAVDVASGGRDLKAPGANALCAGGGRWLGWRPDVGMFGSLGNQRLAGLIAAGPDGTLAWRRNYQTGLGLVLSAPDGSEVEVIDAIVMDGQVLGPGQVIWTDFNAGLRVVGRTPVKTALTPGRTRLATVAGEDWLVYWSEGVGLIAQVDWADVGYILETRPIAFSHDARAVNGELVGAWSTTQGEGPNDLVKITVDRTRPRVPLLPPVDGPCSLCV